jgi:hypothetical protein
MFDWRGNPRLLAALALVLGAAGLLVGAILGRPAGGYTPPVPAAMDLAGVQPGAPLTVYLSDGAPAFLVEHDDGTYDLVSAFDAHRPFGYGQMVWWCPRAQAFENPDTGAKYDEYGVKFAGPAPEGLVSWPITPQGQLAMVGPARTPPPIGTPYVGVAPQYRTFCAGDDPVVFHTFDGWKAWDSPSSLLAAHPDGWALVDGEVTPTADGMVLCALTGCADSAAAPATEPMPSEVAAMWPSPTRRWLVRVEGRQLVDVTRTINPEDWLRGS